MFTLGAEAVPREICEAVRTAQLVIKDRLVAKLATEVFETLRVHNLVIEEFRQRRRAMLGHTEEVGDISVEVIHHLAARR